MLRALVADKDAADAEHRGKLGLKSRELGERPPFAGEGKGRPYGDRHGIAIHWCYELRGGAGGERVGDAVERVGREGQGALAEVPV